MSLVTDWPEIVGAEIARYARPIQIQWPPRGAKRGPDETAPATLVLRVDGAFALEAQHASAIIVERVNAHLGWRCIEKIAFRQGPLAPNERQAPRRAGAERRSAGAGRRARRADRGRGASGGLDEARREGDRQGGADALEAASETTNGRAPSPLAGEGVIAER